MDRLTKEARSSLMRRVRQTGTTPELRVRSGLHRLGLRFVVGDKRLPGRPDLVFPRHRAVVFVNGCFWHGHECRAGRAPSTNQAFWQPKIVANRERDARKEQALIDAGWRVFVVWECETKKPVDFRLRVEKLADEIRAHQTKIGTAKA